MSFAHVYRGKRVLVTGHTGFKGSWLTEWLLALGAEVCGFALTPPTQPSLFEQLNLAPRINHILGDVRDLAAVCKEVESFKPDFIFHLAAQPLVRLSYHQPVETYATNIMGTVHVLEAVRRSAHRSVVIAITTDKCYQNNEWVHSYREVDPMGGFDPYSSSKGAAELVIASYRSSYFSKAESRVKVASARAGNVVGGGIGPDCIRALQCNQTISVRNKIATRPWQHVLEPLSGYLWLGACLSATQPHPFYSLLDGAFNFGPALHSNRTVAKLVQEIVKHWPGNWADCSDPKAVHEANLLNLATDKAHHFLQWSPTWNFEQTIKKTVRWYQSAQAMPTSIADLTRGQIADYTASANEQRIE